MTKTNKATKSNSQHMIFREGDYVVIRPEKPDGKYILSKITEVGSRFKGLHESGRKGLSVDTLQFKADQVLLNLGPTPAPGKVYGLDLVNRYRKRLEHDFWGSVLVFTSLDNATLNLVKKSLDRTAKKIERLGLSHYVDFIDTYLMAKQGKWAGRYHHNVNKNEEGQCNPSVIQYAPEFAEGQPDMMDYVVYHEFGHVLRYNGVVGKKLKLKWLTEYNRSITPFEVSQAELRVLFKHLASYIDGEQTLNAVVREFVNEDEDHKLWLKALMRWFRDVHHLTGKELNIIWENQDVDLLKEMWPQGSIDSSKLSPVVSEYATMNVEELFAESFSFHCTGKKLPGRITQLLEQSIQYAKAVTTKE